MFKLFAFNREASKHMMGEDMEHQKRELEECTQCVCTHCYEIVDPKEILDEWKKYGDNGMYIHHCGADAVICDSSFPSKAYFDRATAIYRSNMQGIMRAITNKDGCFGENFSNQLILAKYDEYTDESFLSTFSKVYLVKFLTPDEMDLIDKGLKPKPPCQIVKESRFTCVFLHKEEKWNCARYAYATEYDSLTQAQEAACEQYGISKAAWETINPYAVDLGP